MENNILELKDKIIDKAIEEWIESIYTMSPEDICIRSEEIREAM